MTVIDQAKSATSEPAAATAPVGVLVGWHLLSLDAPTIAVVWMEFFARLQGTGVPGVELLALFLAVWLLYAGDRLLDARRGGDGLAPRHHFHRKYARWFAMMMVCDGVVLAGLLFRISHIDLALEAGLAMLLIGYFAMVHLTRTSIPKEICTGVFFASAVVVPGFTRSGHLQVAAVLAFAMLCVANGFYISDWEGGTSTLVPTALCVVLVIAGLLHSSAGVPAASVAGLVLLGLNGWRDRMGATTLRSAADLALLSPLLLWFWRV